MSTGQSVRLKPTSVPERIRVYDREFPSFSWPAIHVRVSELLHGLPRGRLLDMPAGPGSLSYRLLKEGFDVVACDAAPENFETPEIPFVPGNLDGRFPFEDASFDYACCIEGPEHIENPFRALGEFARILKPGGRLVVSLPNGVNIEGRLRTLLTGAAEPVYSQDGLRSHLGSHPSARFMLHLSPLSLAQCRFFLECAGFEVETVTTEKWKAGQALLWPLVALIQLCGLCRARRNRDRFFTDHANSTRVLLGGNTLIFMAVKRRSPSLASLAEAASLSSSPS